MIHFNVNQILFPTCRLRINWKSIVPSINDKTYELHTQNQ